MSEHKEEDVVVHRELERHALRLSTTDIEPPLGHGQRATSCCAWYAALPKGWPQLRLRVGRQKQSAECRQSLALGETLKAIELEQAHSRSPLGSQPIKACADQGEVLAPALRPRIEEERERSGLRIKGSKVSALMPITAPAGKGQITFHRFAAMLLRDHVVNLVGQQEGQLRRKQAVLALQTRALLNKMAQRDRDIRLAHDAGARYGNVPP